MNRDAKAHEIVKLIRKSDGQFKAATFKSKIWDFAEGTGEKVIIINQGYGFQEAVAIETSAKGYMVYFPNENGLFEIDTEPTGETLLLFLCEEMIYIEGL